MSKIAVAKGIVQKKMLELLEKKYRVTINPKKLTTRVGEDIYFFVKHRDIPELIENNIIDIGITSWEWIVEKNVKVDVVKKLDWCNTKICVIQNKDNYEQGNSCVTEFPNIAKLYFEENNKNVRIKKISGSSEAYVPLLADMSVDCVETGNTLKENGLRINTIILESKIVVCVKKGTKNLFYKYTEELFGNE